MDKNIFNMLTDKLIKRWGSQKFVAVATLSSITAAATCLASANLIPDDPDQEEACSVTKTTKTKKENKINEN